MTYMLVCRLRFDVVPDSRMLQLRAFLVANDGIIGAKIGTAFKRIDFHFQQKISTTLSDIPSENVSL